MTRIRITRALALLTAAAALALAGCGSDGGGGGYGYGGKDSSASAAKETTAGSAPSSGAFVSLASVPKLGLVLVDSEGFTLYDFHKDQGTKSACYGACAKVWPPLLSESAPRPSNGASAAKLGTTRRSDGSVQVTYGGRPLYTYTGDEKPGEAKGHDIDSFGAEWYALQASGAEAEG